VFISYYLYFKNELAGNKYFETDWILVLHIYEDFRAVLERNPTYQSISNRGHKEGSILKYMAYKDLSNDYRAQALGF
jgi:hypothetical protein